MLTAVISDIHGNLEALTRTLEVIAELKADEIICLGDVVGYGPDPDACVALIREHCKVVLLGNHDQAALNTAAAANFNDFARLAVLWTAEHLSDENKTYLSNLPYTYKRDNILFVHATPMNPEKWHYIFTYEEAQKQFMHFDENICFVGHTHFPGIYSNSPSAKKVNKDDQFIINVGSVGQPRDGNYRISFGLFDDTEWGYKHVRAEYDVMTTFNKIKNNGLPVYLAERLIQGR
ncbi:metallophosphoesterase [bacterium]|nr:metallophosphoesterase [bacterium]